jgi:biofilm PGA synthesis lipoprotein PgaB
MKAELADLGAPLEDFAPPYGDLTPELEALLREAGVRRIWIQEDRLNLPGQGRLARMEVFSAEEALARLGALFGGR